MGKKPTLLELRREYNYGKKQAISSSDLAKAANIPLYLSYAVEIGGFTKRDIATKVLQAFSNLVGIDVRLSDIKIYA